MDRPINQQTRSKQNQTRWLKIIGGLLIAVLVVWGFQKLLRTKAAADEFRYARVELGSLESTITANGEVVPSFEQQLNAPIATEIAKVHLPSGTAVKPGDLILELNKEYVLLNVESRSNLLEVRKNDIALLNLEYDRDLKELEYDDGIKALELAGAESQLADAKRLRKVGGGTDEDVEQAELALETIRLQKKKLENELDYRRKSSSGRRRKLELEASIQEKEVQELRKKLTLTEVRAPSAGVVTWVNEAIGKQVVEGDPLVRLANLESFRIEASCSDRYASQVKVGMPVNVRVNQRDLAGNITSILPAVENNTLSFIVALEQADDTALRPNMRVEVFLITGRKEQAVRLRYGPVFTGAQRQNLFVVRDQKAIRVEVSVGLSNGDYVEILSPEIQPGDRIIISDMSDYDHLSSIDLKE